MSDCNRCSLQRIKSRAKAQGQKVITRPGQNFGMGSGVDVFVVPKGFVPVGPIPREYFVAWFMELPDRCAC